MYTWDAWTQFTNTLDNLSTYGFAGAGPGTPAANYFWGYVWFPTIILIDLIFLTCIGMDITLQVSFCALQMPHVLINAPLVTANNQFAQFVRSNVLGSGFIF